MNTAAVESFAEAVGPIVVKEVRQGLRAKVFAICFGLLLLACLTVALIAAADADGNAAVALGPKYLALFLCGLALVCFFVIPYTGYRSMAREREDETWVLLVLTGLSSRKIVRGKVVSALSQALLYSSAGAPFMVFSYFLNGVDLPTLGLAIVFATCWAFFLTCLAVALGTEGRTRLGRAGVHFIVLGLLGAATVAGMTFGVYLAEKGSRLLDDRAFQVFAIAFPLVLVSTAILLLEGAAAGLSLSSESSVKGVRRVLVAQHVLAIAATYLGVSFEPSPKSAIAAVASILTSLMLVGAGLFAVSERDGYPRVDRHTITWLTGGALRGWRLIIGLLLLDTVAWGALHRLASGSAHSGWGWDHHELASLLAAPLYVGLFLSLAVLVGRWTPLKHVGEPVATRAAFALTTGAAMIFSPVVAVISGRDATAISANFLNPMFGMANLIDRASRSQSINGLMVLTVAFVLVAPFAWFALATRDRERNA